jgi:tetratricopeptide (TPR) repeat protein
VRATKEATSALSLLGPLTENRIVVDDETLAEAHFTSAGLYRLLGEMDAASKHCHEALRLALTDRERSDYLHRLGAIYSDAGKPAEAAQTIREALKYARDYAPNAWIYYQLGVAERALGHLVEARAKLQKALSIVDADPVWHDDCDHLIIINLPIAEISFELEDFGIAAATYQKLSCLYPEPAAIWSCHMWLASCQIHLRQLAKARASLEKIAEAPQVSEDVRDHARKCLFLDLAFAHYDSGEYQPSISACKSALSLCTESDLLRQEILLHLGHSYWMTKSYAEARKCYEQTIALPQATQVYLNSAEECLARLPR